MQKIVVGKIKKSENMTERKCSNKLGRKVGGKLGEKFCGDLKEMGKTLGGEIRRNWTENWASK